MTSQNRQQIMPQEVKTIRKFGHLIKLNTNYIFLKKAMQKMREGDYLQTSFCSLNNVQVK